MTARLELPSKELGQGGEKQESKGCKGGMISWEHTHTKAVILWDTSTSSGIHQPKGAHGVGVSHLPAASPALIDMC